MTSALVIREATEADTPVLARLHVETWNATYPDVKSPPTLELRERQWREAFRIVDGSWFALVIEENGQLIGFAKGKKYDSPDIPGFSGQLDKLYVLRRHHGRGLGRQLIEQVARRFLRDGVTSMVVFSVPENPSGGFYEAMGGEKLLDEKGQFGGAYGWRDLRNVAFPSTPRDQE